MICIQPVEMFKGERRVVTVEISSCDSEPFIIRNPTYKFLYGDVVEEEGMPTLREHELTMTLQPLNAGRYTLECTMEIASEIIIRRLPVFVRN